MNEGLNKKVTNQEVLDAKSEEKEMADNLGDLSNKINTPARYEGGYSITQGDMSKEEKEKMFTVFKQHAPEKPIAGKGSWFDSLHLTRYPGESKKDNYCAYINVNDKNNIATTIGYGHVACEGGEYWEDNI